MQRAHVLAVRVLTRVSKTKARGREGEAGEDQQWHQQVLQREKRCKGAEAKSKLHTFTVGIDIVTDSPSLWPLPPTKTSWTIC